TICKLEYHGAVSIKYDEQGKAHHRPSAPDSAVRECNCRQPGLGGDCDGSCQHPPPLSARVHSFIQENDPFGDRFSAHDLKLIEVALTAAPSAPDSAVREALEAAREFLDDEYSECNDLSRKARIGVLSDKITYALDDLTPSDAGAKSAPEDRA